MPDQNNGVGSKSTNPLKPTKKNMNSTKSKLEMFKNTS